MDSKTGKAGVVAASDSAAPIDKLAHSVTDDLIFNIVHDLLLKVHRDEKMAKANTAAIKVEKLAYDSAENPDPVERPEIRIETDTAVYNHGEVYLKGNPLSKIKDILCPRCHLPRLLYPTDGNGARKSDPSIIYCKKHPYIDKPGFDIYGQTWVAPGPGRGKKKKDMEKKDAAGESTPETRPANVLSFPSATCSKCKRCILVTRLNNHMGSCIGNSGRNASRAAAQKISNGNGNGNGNSADKDGADGKNNTPPSSQRGTPLLGSRSNSPRKREGDDLDDDEDSETSHKKKKLKPSTTKKVILKTKGAAAGLSKKDKVKPSSGLSVEQKLDDDDDNSTVEVAAGARGGSITAVTPVPAPAKKISVGGGKTASPAKKLKALGGGAKQALNPGAAKGGARGGSAESESSGTLSSPPR